MEDLAPPKFLDLLEEFEADDVVTKISEIKTLLEDIESKGKKRRPVQKEKKALQTRIQELSGQFFDVGVRPTIADSNSSGNRKLNLSAESLTLLRKILILVTGDMETITLKDKLLDYTTQFANLIWKGTTAENDSVDWDKVMWQPDETKIHYQDDPMELSKFSSSFEIPELGAPAERPQNRPHEGDDPCARTVEYEWPGQVYFKDEKEIEKGYAFGGIENDVNMKEDEEESLPAMLDPWYNPSVSSSKSGQSPPSSEDGDADESENGDVDEVDEVEVGSDAELMVDPGVERGEEHLKDDGGKSDDESEEFEDAMEHQPGDGSESEDQSSEEEEDMEDTREKWRKDRDDMADDLRRIRGLQTSRDAEISALRAGAGGGINDDVDWIEDLGPAGDDEDDDDDDDDDDAELSAEVEMHRNFTTALLDSRRSRHQGNSSFVSDGELLHGDGNGYPRLSELDDDWDPKPLPTEPMRSQSGPFSSQEEIDSE